MRSTDGMSARTTARWRDDALGTKRTGDGMHPLCRCATSPPSKRRGRQRWCRRDEMSSSPPSKRRERQRWCALCLPLSHDRASRSWGRCRAATEGVHSQAQPTKWKPLPTCTRSLTRRRLLFDEIVHSRKRARRFGFKAPNIARLQGERRKHAIPSCGIGVGRIE